MTVETSLNICPFCFLSHLLKLPGVKHSCVISIFKKKTSFKDCLPSLAKLILRAVILIYCIHFPSYSLLSLLKSYIFLQNPMKLPLKTNSSVQCVYLLLLLLFNISKTFNFLTVLITVFLLVPVTPSCQTFF